MFEKALRCVFENFVFTIVINIASIGVLKVKSDHRSKFSNLSNWKEEACKKSGLQRDSNP